jgi:hypothetical protein
MVNLAQPQPIAFEPFVREQKSSDKSDETRKRKGKRGG